MKNGFKTTKPLIISLYPVPCKKISNMKTKNYNIFREIFSGTNGKLSAKRVFGGISMLTALGCTVYLVVKDGSNNVVENLLMTIFISSISLLGLPAVTGIWNGGSKMTTTKESTHIKIKKKQQDIEE